MVRKLSRRFATNRELIRIFLFIFKAPTSQNVCRAAPENRTLDSVDGECQNPVPKPPLAFP